MEAALVAAEAGIPIGIMAMPNTGSTAPATLAGTLAVGDAEIVSAIVLVQMAYPGAPVYHSFMPGMTHPHTGAYYSHDLSIYAIGVELAHMWGVPTLAGTFGSDATFPGWEFGMGEATHHCYVHCAALKPAAVWGCCKAARSSILRRLSWMRNFITV